MLGLIASSFGGTDSPATDEDGLCGFLERPSRSYLFGAIYRCISPTHFALSIHRWRCLPVRFELSHMVVNLNSAPRSSSDFLSNLLVLLLRVLNSGLSDSGLLAHLSEATAGSLNGVGHSTAYEDLAPYSYVFSSNFHALDSHLVP